MLAAWDLFLDPQMVGQGYWTWSEIGWELPGIPGIPMQNFLGWLLGSIVLMWLLNLLPRKTASDVVPATMLAWVFASNVLANLVFFGRPGVALWGGICMGAVVIPYLWRTVEPAAMVLTTAAGTASRSATARLGAGLVTAVR